MACDARKIVSSLREAWPRARIRWRRTGAVVIAISASAGLWIAWEPIGILAGPILGALYYVLATERYRRRVRLLAEPMPELWRETLRAQVPYYARLEAGRRARFEDDVRIFLAEQHILPHGGCSGTVP